ncbi:hypothetical protein AOLI_G00182450 [Acnodon oligacanthus]
MDLRHFGNRRPRSPLSTPLKLGTCPLVHVIGWSPVTMLASDWLAAIAWPTLTLSCVVYKRPAKEKKMTT